MGRVILGAILGIVLGAILGAGTTRLCEDNTFANVDLRKYSRLPVYRQNNAAELIQGIDLAPAFPTVGAVLGGVIGAVAGATAAIVGAVSCQQKRTSQ